MENKYEKGSEWRKWDLHVHTQSSYDYWDKSITNEDIINKLEENNISVVAITDHHIIDIKRIKKLQNLWKEKNITVLPWIEFLSESRWNVPIHFIWIFWENSNIEHIWWQLENSTNIKKVKWEWKKVNEVYCNLENTIKLVKELWWITTIHAWKKSNSIENITHSLPHLEAQKTDIAYLIDIYELWKENDQKWYRDIVFPAIKKVLPMIICSDNHNIKKYVLKQNCWIKADPTFEWLKQIIYEPEERVFIWEKPEVLDRVKNNKTKYIKSLKIDQVNWYNEKKWVWFKNQEIELNKELVAIIWNKWNWKSAIADILGFLWNTHNSWEWKENNFSFLNWERFRKARLANNFEWTLFWEDWTENKKNLWIDEIDKSNSEKVRYLPQNFFNTLTNNLDNNKFTETLENVIFSHLDDSLKLWKTSFSELKEYKTKIINEKIEQIKINLIEINKNIVKLEKKKQPKEIEKIENKITEKENELKVQEKLLEDLKEIKNPSEDSNISDENKKKFEEIETINWEIKDLDKEIEETKKLKSKLEIDKQNLNDFLWYFESIEKQVWNYKTENKDKYLSLWLDINKIINLEIKKEKVDDKLKEVETSLNDLKYKFTEKVFLNLNEDEKIQKIIKENSLVIKKEELLEKIEKIKKDLSQQEKDYQNYLEEKKRIENKIEEIKWEKKEWEEEYKFDTLEYYKKIKDYLPKKNESWKTQLEKELDKLIEERLKLSVEIYNNKKEIIDLYKQFKEPIDKKVKENEKDLNKENKINIDVRFKIKQDFDKNFLNFINQWKKWSFSWKNEWEQKLKEIYNDKDFSNENNIKEILNDFIKHIQIDKREEYKDKDITDKERSVFEQINEPEEFYNYIFSLDYIDTEFELKSWEKSLEKLSPWEKWTLLLIFYLMIDEEWIPLIIDQPEDNLDNQSVFSMLSKFIKKAKKKRQIIIVTHNPNLAVWADAEQIIYTKIDKENWNTFSFESWSIENKIINNHIVDILEWTMSAFNKRELKYIKKILI